jgi:hypothetical protein
MWLFPCIFNSTFCSGLVNLCGSVMNCVVVWTHLQCGEAVRSQTEVQWQAVVNAVMVLDWLSG